MSHVRVDNIARSYRPSRQRGQPQKPHRGGVRFACAATSCRPRLRSAKPNMYQAGKRKRGVHAEDSSLPYAPPKVLPIQRGVWPAY
jgi:hypothetical protein